MTQMKMQCDLHQAQLTNCSPHLLQLAQLLILGRDHENKVQDAAKIPAAHLQSSIKSAREKSFGNFCDAISSHPRCKELPRIIRDLAKSYIECLSLQGVCIPPDPLRLLFDFVLNVCSEKLVLLNAEDTRDGANVEMFRERLFVFYAECVQTFAAKK